MATAPPAHSPHAPRPGHPARHRAYLAGTAVCALGSVPFLFVGRGLTLVLGLPLWLWSSLLFTAGLSAVTVWGIVQLWRDDTRE